MAVYKLFPSKDSTIYSFYPEMNTGTDAIIEVLNLNVNYNPVSQVSRFLVQFDQEEIEDVIDNLIGTGSFSTYLNCGIATAQGVILKTNLEIYPVSDSWENGSGMYLDYPYSINGVSWRWKDFAGGTMWETSSFGPYITGSYSGSDNAGGATWYTGSNDPNNPNIKSTQEFDIKLNKDLYVDVSDIVNVWYSSSRSIGSFTNIQNNGFIVKWEDVIEFNPSEQVKPILQYFSSDTNTIYPPSLDIKWDDSIYSSSLPLLNTEEIYVNVSNNKSKYYMDSKERFRLNCRPKYPIRTFSTSSAYTEQYRLPQESYYAIKDLDTNEYVVDFNNNYTKISCDNKGNYFDLYMNGLQPERYYKILIKTIINGSVIIKDEGFDFKVINGY